MKSMHYIPENVKDAQWGLSIRTTGYEEIGPGRDYPTPGHAMGYHFSPEKGRILQEYQLLYVVEGEGELCTRSKGKIKLRAGSMFLLFPNEWHTYQPERKTGWKLFWIGFRGNQMDQRVENGFFCTQHPHFQVGYNGELIRLYHQAIEVAAQEKACFQQLLAGIVNQLLGFMYYIEQNQLFEKDRTSIQRIDRARSYMREKLEENLSVPQVAVQVGMGYSDFRKRFKEYTGFSPSQYYLNLRLQHAKELLSMSTLSVKEIAYRLQFQSPDYFSTLFKKKTGLKPSEFRSRK